MYKPNYKAITPKQWEEIFKALIRNDYTLKFLNVEETSASITLQTANKKHRSVYFFFGQGMFYTEDFPNDNLKMNHLQGFQEMSKYIDLGMHNNMPKELTAENGAKALLNGEFSEEIMIYNDLEGVEFPQKVSVTWSTIKAIYSKIVEHYTTEP